MSPTYAKEIQMRLEGRGLERLLRARARRGELRGILNGIDYNAWPLVRRNKAWLQKYCGFNVSAKQPLFGLVARLTEQKGIQYLLPLVPEMVKHANAQFVFLGQGADYFESALEKLADKFPQNIYVRIGFDEKFAHKIYPHVDFFLMPSLYEPCGLSQMISMHYGTVPIVRSTGGLRDSVRDGRTGIMFQKPTNKDLRAAFYRAFQIFSKTGQFRAFRARCTREDFDWRHPVKKYKTLYRSLLCGKI